MQPTSINKTVLMSGADYFSDQYAINAYMDSSIPVQIEAAIEEHQAIQKALESVGIIVTKVDPPAGCQDGVYTANWGLCRGDTVILSYLPNKRKDEEPYAKKMLTELGKKVISAPYIFSGQGDALPCGEMIFMGSAYRTDARMHDFVADKLGYTVIGLQTVPKRGEDGKAITNAVTGWPDSFFYDIDLALAVITSNLIAWCPEAFTEKSQQRVRELSIDKIEVSLEEATKGFACNLVSTGETVIMSANAQNLKSELEQRNFKTITPPISELAKGGGYIRCTTLTLD